MDVFAALADPVRRDLLRELSTGSARVVDLAATRSISRPAVSRHLRVLTEAALVTAEDVGRERHYRLDPEGLTTVEEYVGLLRHPAQEPTTTAPLDHLSIGALGALDTEVQRTRRDRDRRSRSSSPTISHEEEIA